MSKNISLEELSVTIKVVKVDSKKMTQSIFKQLPEESIIDLDTFELKGIPWGKVNLYWGKQRTWGTIHILWSKGNSLKRCIVEKALTDGKYLKKHNDLDIYNSGYSYDLGNIYSNQLRSLVRLARDMEEKKQGSGSVILKKYNTVYHKLYNSEQLFL